MIQTIRRWWRRATTPTRKPDAYFKGVPIIWDPTFEILDTMGLGAWSKKQYFIDPAGIERWPPSAFWRNHRRDPRAGEIFYLSPWWVEVVDYSPKAKMIRYRKLSRTPAPVERMGRLSFLKHARPG